MTANYHIPVWDTITTSWHKVHGTKMSVWAAIGIIILISIPLVAIAASLNYLTMHSATHTFTTILNDPETIFKGLSIYLWLLLATNIIYYIGLLIMLLLNFGLVFIGIKRAMNQPVNYRQVYYAFDRRIILNVILLYILHLLIALPISLLFFYSRLLSDTALPLAIALYNITIVIAIYVGARILLATGFLLEQRLNAWDALKKSYYATRSNALNIIAIVLIQTIIVVISAIPLGIGLIWTIPFSLINYGLIYQRLKNNV